MTASAISGEADAKPAGKRRPRPRAGLARTKPGLLATIVLALFAGPTCAQEITPDPQAWRPLSYADLRRPSGATRTYSDIWKDAIEENNRVYLARGDTRFRDANAPATEAHYVIWSPRKSVVLSILNTATGCTLKEVHPSSGATVKLCPLRLAIYEGVTVRTLDGGRSCFLELAVSDTGPRPESTRAAAYGSYEPATKVARLGLVIEGQAVEGCSLNVPLSTS